MVEWAPVLNRFRKMTIIKEKEVNGTQKPAVNVVRSCSLQLKLVSSIFYQIFIFSPNDNPLKTTKSVFYFIEKALFVLKILKF